MHLSICIKGDNGMLILKRPLSFAKRLFDLYSPEQVEWVWLSCHEGDVAKLY